MTDNTILIAIIVIGIIMVITAIITSKNKKGSERAVYQYTAKAQVMTNAEKQFYDQLLNNLGDRHYIVPQAHLSMFIDHKTKGQNWRAAFTRINGKSVDFLIVEKINQRPVAAIELDDYTHTRPDRKIRDQFVENTLKAAGIPLTRCSDVKQIPSINTILGPEKIQGTGLSDIEG